MSDTRSLGVVIPTRNSVALLPYHIASAIEWLDLADEVIVVDSFSTDGTLELLRQKIGHPGVKFLSHPPGLYASWNAGIRQVNSDYTYISTIGDTITRTGLEKLLAAASSMDADVVLRRPGLQKPGGEPASGDWPIDDMIEALQLTTPRRLAPLEVIVFACVHATRALSGSCASNLYRTASLQQFPFPLEFGTGGDGIWSLRQAAAVSWSILPETLSTFLLHPTTLSQSENRTQNPIRPDAILSQAAQGWLAAGYVTPAQLAKISWDELINCLSRYLEAKAGFDQLRKSPWPWILNPFAWKLRTQRDREHARMHASKRHALRAVRTSSFKSSE